MNRKTRRTMSAAAAAMSTLALGLAGSGCTTTAELLPPDVLVAPYDTVAGEPLWAVVPPANESGTSVFDPAVIGDKLVAAVSQTRGLACLPVNRTIAGMRALGLERVTTPAEAQQLARVLGVDGVLVPTVTAYDPYDPPVLGLAVSLYTVPGGLEAPADVLFDPRLFQTMPTDAGRGTFQVSGQPVATSIEHLDAQNHDVLIKVRAFAEGRGRTESPMGWKAYTASMDLYSEFATHETVRELLGLEWLRLARTSRSAAAVTR